jgi:hypothetical protein
MITTYLILSTIFMAWIMLVWSSKTLLNLSIKIVWFSMTIYGIFASLAHLGYLVKI